MNKNEIAKKLLKLRENRSKSRREVADSLKISLSALTMYELGQRMPRDEVKKRIADYYEESVQSIFFF